MREALDDDGHLTGENKAGRQENDQREAGGNKAEVAVPSTQGQSRVKSFQKRKGAQRKCRSRVLGRIRGSSFHYRL